MDETDKPSECVGRDCPHTMVGRCPGCHRELYCMSVYAFSHGDVACSCGYVVTPRLVST